MSKNFNTEISNARTFAMYLRQMLTLAENVFIFENLPNIINVSYLNKKLVYNGAVVFFEDEILGLIALPFRIEGKLGIYNQPLNIKAYGANGYESRLLKPSDYVIMYDNNGMYPLYLDIKQYACRMALDTRTCDVNISQQRTNRFFRTTAENEKTVRNIMNSIDRFDNEILTFKNIALEDLTAILATAPYVSDKIDIHKNNIYNEFLRLIGICSVVEQKKERLLKDEIQFSVGGTIASRFSRSQPRIKAVNQINQKFGTNIVVKYYDGTPVSEGEVISNV